MANDFARKTESLFFNYFGTCIPRWYGVHGLLLRDHRQAERFVSALAASTLKYICLLWKLRSSGIQCPHRGAVFSYTWRHLAFPYEDDDREACNIFFVWEMLRPLLKGKNSTYSTHAWIPTFNDVRFCRHSDVRYTRLRHIWSSSVVGFYSQEQNHSDALHAVVAADRTRDTANIQLDPKFSVYEV